MPTRREILSREVAEKVRLEALVKPGIRKIFARVVDDFRVAVARTGQPQEVRRYRTSFESLLEDHYRRVQKSFSGAILLHNNVLTFSALRQKQNKQAEDDSEFDERVFAIFLLWREQRAPVQADIITGTTARDMQDALDQARQALREEGKPADNRSLALTAAIILKRITKGRIDLIALTETQAAAEATKAIEASTAARVVIPGIPLPSDVIVLPERVTPTPSQPQQPAALKKSWLTLRDKRVRPTHREAEGQTKPINEAFNVGSSRMMYPGDTSLGAPIREIANCRCSAMYLF